MCIIVNRLLVNFFTYSFFLRYYKIIFLIYLFLLKIIYVINYIFLNLLLSNKIFVYSVKTIQKPTLKAKSAEASNFNAKTTLLTGKRFFLKQFF